MEVPDYDLPEAAIAQTPVEPRHSARLLDALDPSGALVHRRVWDLPELIGPGDAVVVNDSRVIPARLALEKRSGGAAEVLLLEPDLQPDPGTEQTEHADPAGWTALVRPGRRLPPGTVLGLPGWAGRGDEPVLEIGARLDGGQRRIRFHQPIGPVLQRAGKMALPPYIHRELSDPDRYQTVYADQPGSVAAPTAGLHLTADLLEQVKARGAAVCSVDLAVGLATFRPVKSDRVENHVIHRERYRVPESTWAACRSARRVVAIGTTTVRALETAASTSSLEGESELFIRPGFSFSVVDVLLTNFHLPRSTLLLLLEAFTGPRWRDIYAAALAEGYRFLSFGDAMVVGRA
ncbi:MAG: tRNA preQ1(34) S-adenosylmethionine ribosyltransferase-isomerase QueA [Acidimicrobiales bacterium]|nr:tRNA preQ1(34) S-adenosylmethionine ribosyltransferase-isomerase QueA [Acidimicrobiales bacterium]